MSRLGKQPIVLSEGTQAKIENGFIIVKGPKGELKQELHKIIKIDISDKEIKVSVAKPEDKKERSFWGLFYSLINNMVIVNVIHGLKHCLIKFKAGCQAINHLCAGGFFGIVILMRSLIWRLLCELSHSGCVVFFPSAHPSAYRFSPYQLICRQMPHISRTSLAVRPIRAKNRRKLFIQ